MKRPAFAPPHRRFVRLVSDGQFVAAAVLSRDVPVGVAFTFLDAMLAEWNEHFPGWGSSLAARVSSTLASEQFTPHLRRLMREVETNEHGSDVVREVEDELRAVKASVVTNIDKALMRGEVVDAMAQRAGALRHEGQRFKRAGRQLYAKMWWQDYTIAAYTIGGVGTVVYLALACVCGITLRACAMY